MAGIHAHIQFSEVAEVQNPACRAAYMPDLSPLFSLDRDRTILWPSELEPTYHYSVILLHYKNDSRSSRANRLCEYGQLRQRV